MGKRKSKSWRVKTSTEQVAKMAAMVIDDHARHLSDGMIMCASSGMWRTKHGTYTGRFAYRNAERTFSIVHTIRGITFDG